MKEIILRFLGGDASSEEIVMLQAWLEESEANRQYFDEVNSTYQASITLNRLNHNKVDHAWQKLSERIEQEPIVHKKTKSRSLLVYKIAATVCLLIATAALLFRTGPGQQRGTTCHHRQKLEREQYENLIARQLNSMAKRE